MTTGVATGGALEARAPIRDIYSLPVHNTHLLKTVPEMHQSTSFSCTKTRSPVVAKIADRIGCQ